MIRVRTITRRAVRSPERLQRVGVAIRDVLRRSALEVERGAKRRAPVAFGRLRASIATHGPDVQRTRIAYVVAVGAAYGKFVEFGTGPAGAGSQLSATARDAMTALGYRHGPGGFFPPLRPLALWAKRAGVPAAAVWSIARAIGRRGLRARPYLFPAFEEVRPTVASRVRERVRRALGA